MGSLWFRIVVYALVVFLVLIVYAGQQESTARGALQRASRRTVPFLAWTAVAVVAMEALQWLFID
jgi:hypothetical protein